ncbi:MAG: glucan biosynthesis protein, partial [Sinobacteraceae bacterium]|nr:glucan biosynthesis protein [Nevskiaceae bacterium]
MLDRRAVLGASAASLALAALARPLTVLADPPGLRLGKPQPFSFDALSKEMQALAARPYQRDNSLPAALLDRIDYEEHGRIKFKPEDALYGAGPGEFPITF